MPYLEYQEINPGEAPGECTLGRLGALTVFTMYNTKTGETLTGTDTQIMTAIDVKKQSINDWEYKEGTEKKVDKWPKVVEGKTFGARAFSWLEKGIEALDPGKPEPSDLIPLPGERTPIPPAQAGMSPGTKNALLIGGLATAVGLGLLFFLKK